MGLSRPPVVLAFTFLVCFSIFSTVISNNSSQVISIPSQSVEQSTNNSPSTTASTSTLQSELTNSQQYSTQSVTVLNTATVSLQGDVSNSISNIKSTLYTTLSKLQSSYESIQPSFTIDNTILLSNRNSVSSTIDISTHMPINPTSNLGLVSTSSIITNPEPATSSSFVTLSWPEPTTSTMSGASPQPSAIMPSVEPSTATPPSGMLSSFTPIAEPSQTRPQSVWVPTAEPSSAMSQSLLMPSAEPSVTTPNPGPSLVTPSAEPSHVIPNPEPSPSSMVMSSSVVPEPTSAPIPSFSATIFLRLSWSNFCPLLDLFNENLASLLSAKSNIKLNGTDIVQRNLKCNPAVDDPVELKLHVINPMTKTADRILTQDASNLIIALIEENKTDSFGAQFAGKFVSANFEDSKPPNKETKWPIWLLVLIGVGALAIICWLSCCICLCCAKKKKKPRRYSYQIGSLHIPRGKLDKEGEQGWKNYENFYGERIGAKKNEALELYGERTDAKK